MQSNAKITCLTPLQALGALLRCAVCCDDFHIQPDLTTNLFAWATLTFTKLPSKHTVFRGRCDIYLKLFWWHWEFCFLLFGDFCVYLGVCCLGSTLEDMKPTEARITHVQSLHGLHTNQTRKHSRGVRQAGQHIYIHSHTYWRLFSTTSLCMALQCEG